MSALVYLVRHPERNRAPIRVAFTVDEEVGRGAEDFDLDAFGADVAYTLDGSALGELETETFSASSVRVTIRGLSVHPGTAKGKLVNAVKLAAELVSSLPRGPAVARDHRGSSGVRAPAPHLRRRGRGDRRLHRARSRRRAPRGACPASARSRRRDRRPRAARSRRGRAAGLLSQHAAVHRPDSACGRGGPRGHPPGGRQARLAITRGGTDGAVLSAKGLPTPNLFTGGQEYHSVREWASVQDMGAAAATIVELAGVWAEPAA